MIGKYLKHYSDLRSFHERGQWPLSLIADARKLAEHSRQSSDWLTYVDIRHSLQGLSIEDCLSVSQQCKASHCLSPKLRLKLCNLIMTTRQDSSTGESERRAICMKFLPESQSPLTSSFMDVRNTGYLGSFKHHYPALLLDSDTSITSSAPLNRDWRKRRRLAMHLNKSSVTWHNGLRQILENRTGIRHLSDDYAASVAVVGNSPDLLGQGRGELIDSHDLVIRFNKPSADNDQIVHTGRRTDIWVMSPSTPIESCPPDAQLVVVSGLRPLTRPSFYWHRLLKIGKPLSEFDEHVWYELVQHFNAPPSAGTSAIAALGTGAQRLQLTRFGFTTAEGVHGKSANHHNDVVPASTRHNWQAEIDWLRERIT